MMATLLMMMSTNAKRTEPIKIQILQKYQVLVGFRVLSFFVIFWLTSHALLMLIIFRAKNFRFIPTMPLRLRIM